MNPYIIKLNDYLTEHPPNYGYRDVDNLLDMLYNFYSENNPVNSTAIKQSFEKLEHFLDRFSLTECDGVLDILCDLCSQHEEQAFRMGVQVGVRLFNELGDCHGCKHPRNDTES